MGLAGQRLRYLGRRALQAVPIVIAIVVCNFILLNLAPGDAATVLAGEAGSAGAETTEDGSTGVGVGAAGAGSEAAGAGPQPKKHSRAALWNMARGTGLMGQMGQMGKVGKVGAGRGGRRGGWG